jgi:arylsulfatase A-like enzyme
LLVVYDARRRDDFSFGRYGKRRGDTPFLAALKDRAVYFENAIAPGCWTVPVHASMFTGRSVCDLGIDYYNPGHTILSPEVPSLAEILGAAGYQTVAYADHPFFYGGDLKLSLVRGFAQFSVIAEFANYSSYTNVGTPGHAVERRSTLTGNARHGIPGAGMLRSRASTARPARRPPKPGEAMRDDPAREDAELELP